MVAAVFSQPNNRGKAKHSNYLIQNVRFEEPAALFGLQNPEANYNNVIFRNISIDGAPVSSVIRSKVKGAIFENVILNGKLVTRDGQLPMEDGSKIDDMIYLPKKQTPDRLSGKEEKN